MLFAKALPSDLELELVPEPLCVDVLLYDIVVLVVDFDWWQWQVLAVWYHVRFCFRQDIDMKNVVDLPMSGELKLVR